MAVAWVAIEFASAPFENAADGALAAVSRNLYGLCHIWSRSIIAAAILSAKRSLGVYIMAAGDLVEDFHHIEGLDLLL
jgi:predicted glycosyltransferase